MKYNTCTYNVHVHMFNGLSSFAMDCVTSNLSQFHIKDIHCIHVHVPAH